MRNWYISEMDDRAAALARKYGMGVEIIDFCIPQNLEDEERIAARALSMAGFEATLHAPYCEIFPSAIDPLVRDVALHRLMQAANVCKRLGIRRMVTHSGDEPQMYYPEWFVPRSIEFWKEFMEKAPDELEVAVENVLDRDPETIRRICDGVGDERLKICLDVGHVNAYSAILVEEWIRSLGARIGHVHLHNNAGVRDTHDALDQGSMDIVGVLKLLDEYAPMADICIESMDAAACLEFLLERGILNV